MMPAYEKSWKPVARADGAATASAATVRAAPSAARARRGGRWRHAAVLVIARIKLLWKRRVPVRRGPCRGQAPPLYESRAPAPTGPARLPLRFRHLARGRGRGRERRPRRVERLGGRPAHHDVAVVARRPERPRRARVRAAERSDGGRGRLADVVAGIGAQRVEERLERDRVAEAAERAGDLLAHMRLGV